LLEKSRVTKLGLGERNYHIFYHFIKGCKDLDKYHIKSDPAEYNFLNSDCINVAGIKDLELYEDTLASFKKLGFNNNEQTAIFRMISGILLLGNLEFDEKSYSDSNPCTIKN